MRKRFYFLATTSLILALCLTWFWFPAVWLLALVMGIVILGIYDILQTRHTVLRNYPVGGHGRWIMEWLRPMMYQYFIESETDGVPVNRMFRSVVYQRAKGVLDTVPLGTKMDTYRTGYEWIDHSLMAQRADELELDPRIVVGGPDCKQPYAAHYSEYFRHELWCTK